MDFLGRILYLTWCCVIFGNVIEASLFGDFKSAFWKLLGSKIPTHDQSQYVKRFVDEPATAWSAWHTSSKCTVTCGDGFMELQRDCNTGNRRDCEQIGGTYWKIDHCDMGICGPHWLEWTSNKCSKTCGVGVAVRRRTCTTGNNADCPAGKYFDFTTCDDGDCVTTTEIPTTKTPAVWSAWGPTKACSKTCGTGYTEKTRTCSSGRVTDCQGHPWAVVPCNDGECIVDGSWGDWAAWGDCSATCGSSQRSRNRTCVYPDPTNIGQACVGDGMQTEDCTKPLCAVDGRWSDWGTYTACSATCGSGFAFRNRNCIYTAGAPKGKPCSGSDFDMNTCNNGECAVDGVWVEWTTWSTCSETCGDGYIFRNRFCKYETGRPKGKACVGDTIDGKPCKIGECPVDGVLGSWSSWSSCSHTCNSGIQFRSRSCNFDKNAPRGKDCVGDLRESRDCGQQECPVDGTWGTWEAWQQCSETCGSGTTARTRQCEYKTLTAPHGKVCPGENFEKKNCSETVCTVDGIWGTWSRFSKCSVTCGQGIKIRTRSCTFDPTVPHGRDCAGSSQEVKDCKKSACAVDGKLTDWNAWSFCTFTCGGGTEVRSRDCYFPPGVPHGAACVGNLTDTSSCNDVACPVTTTVMTTTTEALANGSWSDWSSWTTCSASCDTGNQTRIRTCTFPDHTQHDQLCPGSSVQSQACNTDHCPVDGAWSSWSLFARCSASCGNGTHTRSRTCSYDARYAHGQPCNGTSTNTESCFAGACPVDGTWGQWSVWATCLVTCGGSSQDRVRICEYSDVAPHGQPCAGATHEIRACGGAKCAVDGQLTVWSTWTDCPVTCGNGTHARDRTCNFPADAPHGKDCIGELFQAQPCNEELCPVDGNWTQWSTWGSCSKSCNQGLQQRSRSCLYDRNAPHGLPCAGASKESQDCNTAKCPVDGFWGTWQSWSSCSQTCDDGTHTRTRPCSYLNGVPKGNPCVGDDKQSEACTDGPCPVDGQWADWTGWSSCSESCGGGQKLRDRICEFPAGAVHGHNCSGNDTEVEICNDSLCPVDGTFTGWSEWSNCSATCDGGLATRKRACVFDDKAPHGTTCIGDYSQNQNCSMTPCPVDGQWSAWSEFTNCSKTCGNGTMFRKRICEFTPGHPHGIDCAGGDSETMPCSSNPCPVDGKFTDWGTWSKCSKSCENGTQSRTRRCEYDDTAPHGQPCVGDYKEAQPCNVDLCPVNGHWSNWTVYTSCSNTCGNGTHSRTRACIFHDPAPHGSQCFGATNETNVCNDGPCAVDGSWSAWTTWSNCSATCGGGKRTRGRVCEYPDGVPHGNNCSGSASEIEDCGTDACPVDGVLTVWSPWSACSETCGDGIKFKTRRCFFPDNSTHGADCNGTLQEQDKCTLPACKVDGQWSTWNSWGVCNATCGGGTKLRTRDCAFPANVTRGDNCTGDATDTAVCKTDACPVDGQWGPWGEYSACTKSCGNGTATRSRVCEYDPNAPHGIACTGDAQETIRCNVTDCRMDGVWGDWSSFSACSATCGDSNKTRSRVCTYPTSNHGDACPGDDTETTMCNATLCPVDGSWSEWGNWSACSETCDIGSSIRSRTCLYDDLAPHGIPCPGTNEQQKDCSLGACTVDGQWSQWTVWSVCSQTCENGTQTRTRNCVYSDDTAPKGKNCTGDATESMVCTNPDDCSADGAWSDWTAWSTCPVTCGAAQKNRSRDCVFDPAKPKGHDCFGSGSETVDCGLQACAVDGQWGTWKAWTSCSVTCGSGGSKTRTRTCDFADPAPHGKDCVGNADETQNCDANLECPASGFWEVWERWHRCSVTCGGGTRKRTRQCVFPPHVNQGKYCEGSSRDSEACNTAACP